MREERRGEFVGTRVYGENSLRTEDTKPPSLLRILSPICLPALLVTFASLVGTIPYVPWLLISVATIAHDQ